MADLHEVKCPWCSWSKTDSSAAYLGARLVTHANAEHDVWLKLGRAEYYVLGDPDVEREFKAMRVRQRPPGDNRPWREIRGSVAA